MTEPFPQDIPPDRFYVLDQQGQPVATQDLEQWAEFMETDRRLLTTQVEDDLWVITCFVGINLPTSHLGPPRLYETMLWDQIKSMSIWRYETEAEAREGHAAAVEAVRRVGWDAEKIQPPIIDDLRR